MIKTHPSPTIKRLELCKDILFSTQFHPTEVIMSIPSLPATLTPALSGREAIADAVYRCLVAIDTDNPSLFKSSFTNDAIFELNGTTMNGFDEINEQCYASISKLDTNHYLSNLRINILDGDSKAEMTCSALAQHYHSREGMKPDTVPLLAGSFYWLELVKDESDGLWKIKHWKLKANWGQGDWGVFGH